jgi:Glycoside Hydrolase Family 113
MTRACLAAPLLLAACLPGCRGATRFTAPQPSAPAVSVSPSLEGHFEYQGATQVSWSRDEYESPAAAVSRQALADAGANWAGVLLTWYMPDRDSATIAPDAERTPSDAAVAAAIEHFHALGLKVMLKPHVDVLDGTWRGQVLPPDRQGWFRSYDAFMREMARLAEAERVEMLCVGTELVRLTGPGFRDDWERVIADVRSDYHGLLTYAANANSAGDEFRRLSFVDLLDVAGLDAYVPLTDSDSPTREELAAGWSHDRNGEDMLAAYRDWQRGHGKPVIFTEIGYRSANGANRAPWDWGAALAPDPQEQADCYDAAFAAFLPERAWMKGLFFWSWDVARPPPGDTSYTPWTKPAGELLKERYSGS